MTPNISIRLNADAYRLARIAAVSCGKTLGHWLEEAIREKLARVARTFALALALVLGVTALLPLPVEGLGLELRLWLLANPALVGLGYVPTRYWACQPRWAILGWLGWFGLTLLLFRGIEGVPWLPVVGTNAWGGLLLNLLLGPGGNRGLLPPGRAAGPGTA